MRRSPARIRHVPDLSTLVPFEPRWPKRRHPMPGWLKALLAVTGFAGLVMLARLDFGTGESLVGRKAPERMLQVDIPPPKPKVETPTDQPVTPQDVPVPSETPQMPSVPSIGLLQDDAAGGSGSGLPGLDLGMAGSSGSGMAVAAGGGGHGGGTGTGVGSGSGSSAGTGARFTYNPGETDTDPQLVTSGDPVYPRRAREDGIEPRVELRILVDERGRVEQVEVQGAPPGYGFEAALRTAVTQWRFQPATKGGVPVRTWVSQGYQFKLD
jgi:protein TonB